MDQVMSMELGADDFVQKPFNTSILIAKIQAIYRRVYEFSKDEKRVIQWQKATLDLAKDSINKDDTIIYLSKSIITYKRFIIPERCDNRISIDDLVLFFH